MRELFLRVSFILIVSLFGNGDVRVRVSVCYEVVIIFIYR
jgi:hypothetical protein